MTVAGIAVAAQDNDTLGMLQATQARIAEALDDECTPARDLASLSKRLMEINREIKAIEAAEDEEADDHVSEEDADFDPQAI